MGSTIQVFKNISKQQQHIKCIIIVVGVTVKIAIKTIHFKRLGELTNEYFLSNLSTYGFGFFYFFVL